MYDSIYPVSDRMKKENNIGLFSPNIRKTLDSLNLLHPKHFFYKAKQLANQSKFNDASLLYITGRIRYKYYNWCKRTKTVTEDEKLETQLNETTGELLLMFLRSNIDNFILILNSSVAFCEAHDYSFFSKSNNSDYYKETYSSFKRMSTGFKVNREYFEKMWLNERKDYEETRK